MCNLIEQFSEVVVIVHFLMTSGFFTTTQDQYFYLIEVKYELVNIPFQHKTQGRA